MALCDRSSASLCKTLTPVAPRQGRANEKAGALWCLRANMTGLSAAYTPIETAPQYFAGRMTTHTALEGEKALHAQQSVIKAGDALRPSNVVSGPVQSAGCRHTVLPRAGSNHKSKICDRLVLS